MNILSIKTLPLVTFFFLYGCEFTPEEMYLYREADFVQVEGSYSLVAKDSIRKEKSLVSFIINDKDFQDMTIDCKKNLIKVNYIFKNGAWGKTLNPQWVKVKDDAIKNYVCQ